MKLTGKYRGCLPEILHSPAEFAVAGKPFTVSAACRPDGSGEVPASLVLHLNAKEKLPMTPVDSLEWEKGKFEIYTVEIPAEKVCGDCITYIIAAEEILSAITEKVTLPVYDLAKLPPQPPLRVSEIYGRPKGKNVTRYIEVTNPSDSDTDLYDYEFLFWEDETSPKGEPTGRMPMADEPGTQILHPSEYAAIWGIRARNFTPEKNFDTVDKFWKVFNNDTVNKDAGIQPSDGRIIPVKYYTTDDNGVKTDVAPDMPEKCKTCYLCIVPRGKNADEAVFSVKMGLVYADWDTPTRRSSYWTASALEPSVGICLRHREGATPGFPGRGQGKQNLLASKPLIIPALPDSCVYIGDGAADIAFACVETDEDMPVTCAFAEVKTESGCLRIDAEQREDGLWHAQVPVETVEKLKELEYTLACTDGCMKIVSGDTYKVPVYDNAGPRVISGRPSEKYAFDCNDDLTIRINYYDISGIDISKCRVEIDGKDLTGKTDFYEDCLQCLPEDSLTCPGDHVLTLKLCDGIGNVSNYTVNYSVSDMKALNAYIGEVHCHTADSDGSGKCEDAYEYARDTGKVDYFAVTDHSHYTSSEKILSQIKIADSFNEPGKFAALYGWEMTWNNTCGYWGHMNILNANEVVNRMDQHDMPDMFAWLEKHPTAVGMFNHPGYNWGNFDEFGHYTENADRAMCLAEIKGPVWDREYAHMLSKGWHASPVSNEDNHNTSWTTSTNMYGCVLAPSLTRENVMDAFRARRTYTTSDRYMKIFYKINGQWMGSHLDNPGSLSFDISISTESLQGIGRIEIIAEDNNVVAVKDAGVRREIAWKPVLSPDFDYYYIKITGNGRYCVTAPIWLDNRPKLEIGDAEYNASYNNQDSAIVSVNISNRTGEKLKDLRVKYYLSGPDGLRIGDNEPYCTVCSGSLDSDSTLRVSRLLPEIPGYRRVTMIASGKMGKTKVCSTKYIMISPVTIVSALAHSGKIGVNEGEGENLYPYVTLYNSSMNDVKLDGGKLSYWNTTGKVPTEDHIMPTDGITVPARQPVIIWMRKDPSLTADDFNKAFGTEFEENVNLFATDVKILDGSADGRRLDLTLNGEVISRVHWNYCLDCDGKKKHGIERRFAYRPNMTLTSVQIGEGAPEPGKLDEEQMRRRFTVLMKRREKKQAGVAAKKDAKEAKRRKNLALTKTESTAAAVGAATAAAAFTAAIGGLFRKSRKDKEE